MLFGLCHALVKFEQVILADIPRSFCIVYLGNLLVHTNDFDRTLAKVHGVLTAICQARLWLNPTKCHLLTRKTEFLGHMVSARV